MFRLTERLRSTRPDLALTTDLIVGFPGETRSDFEATLELMRELSFVDSFSFKYSSRPGTRATELPDPVPPREAQERLVELQALQRRLTLSYHQSRVGQTTEILVEGPSRRGAQLQGRDPQHRVVNIVGDTSEPGDLVLVRIVAATPHSLVAEARRGGEPLKPPTPRADEQGRAQTFAGAG